MIFLTFGNQEKYTKKQFYGIIMQCQMTTLHLRRKRASYHAHTLENGHLKDKKKETGHQILAHDLKAISLGPQLLIILTKRLLSNVLGNSLWEIFWDQHRLFLLLMLTII